MKKEKGVEESRICAARCCDKRGLVWSAAVTEILSSGELIGKTEQHISRDTKLLLHTALFFGVYFVYVRKLIGRFFRFYNFVALVELVKMQRKKVIKLM